MAKKLIDPRFPADHIRNRTPEEAKAQAKTARAEEKANAEAEAKADKE